MINTAKALYWSPDIWAMAHGVAWKCLICQKVNKTRAKQRDKGGRPLAVWPFQRVQIDFTELPEKGGMKYLLVLKDHPGTHHSQIWNDGGNGFRQGNPFHPTGASGSNAGLGGEMGPTHPLAPRE